MSGSSDIHDPELPGTEAERVRHGRRKSINSMEEDCDGRKIAT